MQNESNFHPHTHIEYFNPDVTSLAKAYQDFSSALSHFHAGKYYDSFDDFIKKEAVQYQNSGDGVSYVVWNVFYDDTGQEEKREIVAYYTLSTTSIPYEDRIRLDPDEAQKYNKEFDIQICGIPAIEIKMFAVNEKYQNLFYQYDNEDLPIAAWIMRNIIYHANSLLTDVIGFKALFLHAIPEAVSFYIKNGFHPMEINMKPLHSVDSEFTPMYLSLREIHMIYDD